MQTKLLLWLAVASISTATWATDPEALNVHRLDATIRSMMLDNVQTIRFNAEETAMLIHTTDQQTLTYGVPDILKVIFGDYLADNETTPVETPYIASPNDTHKILENGQLIIIKDGVKYTILGIRL